MFSHVNCNRGQNPRWSSVLRVNNTMSLFYGVRNEQSWLPDHEGVRGVCVTFLPTFPSEHLPGDGGAPPGSLATLKALFHLFPTERFGCLVHRKVSQKHKNTYADMLMNALAASLLQAVAQQCFCF